MLETREETYTTTHTKTIYITSDGKEFETRWIAQEHEAKLQQGKRNIKHEIIHTFENEDTAHLYYIDSPESFTYMTITEWFDYTPNAYAGPGWYLHIWHDGGDGADWNEVYYLPSYLDRMKQWITNVEHLTKS